MDFELIPYVSGRATDGTLGPVPYAGTMLPNGEIMAGSVGAGGLDVYADAQKSANLDRTTTLSGGVIATITDSITCNPCPDRIGHELSDQIFGDAIDCSRDISIQDSATLVSCR